MARTAPVVVRAPPVLVVRSLFILRRLPELATVEVYVAVWSTFKSLPEENEAEVEPKVKAVSVASEFHCQVWAKLALLMELMAVAAVIEERARLVVAAKEVQVSVAVQPLKAVSVALK